MPYEFEKTKQNVEKLHAYIYIYIYIYVNIVSKEKQGSKKGSGEQRPNMSPNGLFSDRRTSKSWTTAKVAPFDVQIRS